MKVVRHVGANLLVVLLAVIHSAATGPTIKRYPGFRR
jgi:hypothetical protein